MTSIAIPPGAGSTAQQAKNRAANGREYFVTAKPDKG